jgi:hypothetical protein
MTYPNGSGVINNQWGPALPTANGGDEPVYSPTATPAATGAITVPQSPSGSVTGQSAASNYASGETSTQTRLSEFGESEPQQGTVALNAPYSFNGLNAAIFQTFRWE